MKRNSKKSLKPTVSYLIPGRDQDMTPVKTLINKTIHHQEVALVTKWMLPKCSKHSLAMVQECTMPFIIILALAIITAVQDQELFSDSLKEYFS